MLKAQELENLFPDGRLRWLSGQMYEVVELGLGAQPQNCTILAQGLGKYDAERNRLAHFLVQLDGQLAYVRVGTAKPEAGYPAFATIELSGADAIVEDRMRERITALTQDCVTLPSTA